MTEYELDTLRVLNRIADAFEGMADALRSISVQLNQLTSTIGGDLTSAVEQLRKDEES